jgi:twinkle protein
MGFVRTHRHCVDCGSTDACSINADGSSYCFSCNTFTPSKDGIMTIAAVSPLKPPTSLPDNTYVSAIAVRKISLAAADKYGVTQDDKGTLYFPYADKDGVVIAYKSHPTDKNIRTHGAWQEAEPLFGMSKFNKGCAKSVMVTEGEADCLAAYQMNGHKWPVVSIRGGAASAAKDFKAAYEWLDSFETIVVCFDNDEAGKAAAKKVCDVFGSKIKLMKLDDDYKDACDYLKNGSQSKFMSAYWQAEQYVPSGLINGASLWDEVSKPMSKPDAAWPCDKLDKMLCGLRKRELVTIAAGTGSGKTTFVRQLVHHLLMTTEDKIGLMFLEESASRTALGLMSIEAQKPLHLPTTETTPEEKRAAFDATLGTGRITLLNHFGSLNLENILDKMRWMAKGQNCSWIVLDHYQMTISGMEVDERKALDMLLTRLRTFVEETGVGVFGISHTRRDTSTKGAENGAELTLSSLRGTAGIGQLSDAVIALQRDQQNDDEKIRNTTVVRLLKSRYTGETGPAGFLYYDKHSNRLIELDEMPEAEEQDVL